MQATDTILTPPMFSTLLRMYVPFIVSSVSGAVPVLPASSPLIPNTMIPFVPAAAFTGWIGDLFTWLMTKLHREHAQVVNEFLAHLDDEDPSFLLIAATNRADLLDEAATRRGRFDQQYEVGLPDKKAREKIFKVRLQTLPTDLDQEEYEKLAELSTELSSADIVGIVDDAAMQAAERDAQAITYNDLAKSFPDSMTT